MVKMSHELLNETLKPQKIRKSPKLKCCCYSVFCPNQPFYSVWFKMNKDKLRKQFRSRKWKNKINKLKKKRKKKKRKAEGVGYQTAFHMLQSYSPIELWGTQASSFFVLSVVCVCVCILYSWHNLKHRKDMWVEMISFGIKHKS